MPSVRISTDFCLTNEVVLNGAKIPAKVDMRAAIYCLHVNNKEWIEPLKYVPDRFNPESIWSHTPGGAKRNPMSFGPFLGGKRICVGKTFAESIARLIIPMIVS
jgi:cytochrome P450